MLLPSLTPYPHFLHTMLTLRPPDLAPLAPRFRVQLINKWLPPFVLFFLTCFFPALFPTPRTFPTGPCPRWRSRATLFRRPFRSPRSRIFVLLVCRISFLFPDLVFPTLNPSGFSPAQHCFPFFFLSPSFRTYRVLVTLQPDLCHPFRPR